MKKISIIAAVVLAAIMTSCGNGTPKANMKSDVDSLCYAIGMAQSQGLKDYLAMRMGVDTAYMNEFIKGLNDGANAGDDKKQQAYIAGLQIGQQVSTQMIAGLNHELFGEDSAQYVSQNNFMAGFVAGTLEDTTIMNVEAANEYTQTNMRPSRLARCRLSMVKTRRPARSSWPRLPRRKASSRLRTAVFTTRLSLRATDRFLPTPAS